VSSASTCVLLLTTSATSRAGITKFVRHSSGSARRPTSPLQRSTTPSVVETADHTCTVAPGGYEPDPNPPSTVTAYLAAGSVDPAAVATDTSETVDVEVAGDPAEQPPMSTARASPTSADTIEDRGPDALDAAVLLVDLLVVVVSLMNVTLPRGLGSSVCAGGIGVWPPGSPSAHRVSAQGADRLTNRAVGFRRGVTGWWRRSGMGLPSSSNWPDGPSWRR
jgi:hypothetical protein